MDGRPAASGTQDPHDTRLKILLAQHPYRLKTVLMVHLAYRTLRPTLRYIARRTRVGAHSRSPVDKSLVALADCQHTSDVDVSLRPRCQDNSECMAQPAIFDGNPPSSEIVDDAWQHGTAGTAQHECLATRVDLCFNDSVKRCLKRLRSPVLLRQHNLWALCQHHQVGLDSGAARVQFEFAKDPRQRELRVMSPRQGAGCEGCWDNVWEKI